jgi:ribosomal protein L37AE/L43A
VTKTDENQPLACPKCGFRSILSQFREITVKSIVCPGCRAVLKVMSQAAGPLTCPRCQYAGDISAYPPYVPAARPASPNPAESAALTSIPTDGPQPGDKLSRPGMLVLVESDCECAVRKIVLKRGKNVIGRKAPGSQASIRLETADAFMSRSHTCIELAVKPGERIEHLLSDVGSVNGTFHNGERLGPGDTIILTPGDLVRIGHTVFKFTPD